LSGTSICIGCGLCCDGTLHGDTRVKPEDIPAAEAAGLSIAADGEKLFFEQPCIRFSCGRCTVYDFRPGVCQKYRCALLRGVESGKTGEADARVKISLAKDLVAQIVRFAPEAITPAARAKLASSISQSIGGLSGETRDRAAEALLHLNALEFLLEGSFRYRKPPSKEGLNSLGEGEPPAIP